MRSLKPFFDFEGRERKWVPSGGGAHFLSLVTGKGRRLQAAPGGEDNCIGGNV